MKNYLLLLLSFLLVQISYSQTIKGEITNGVEIIPFANIYVKGIGIGAASDKYGRFVLNDVPQGMHELVVSSNGHIIGDLSWIF